MRNLKRVLSLALALVMVLGMMVITTSAATFTDAEEITYQEAVDVVSAIGVINGVEAADGTFAFNPTETLTREQGAKMLCYLLLGKSTAEKLSGSGAFTDVAATRWSAGAIDYCASLGILAGVGDNKFNPTGELTGVQYGKMLLCALGYKAKIEGYEGKDWAVNIAVDMMEAGLTHDDIALDQPLTREAAAQMTLQALQANTVWYRTPGTEITMADGTKIVVGASAAEIVTAADGAAATITDETGIDYVQLGESLYPSLNLDGGDADDFTRPSSFGWYIEKNRVAGFNGNDVRVYNEMQTPVVTYTSKVSNVQVAKDLKGFTFNGTELKTKDTEIAAGATIGDVTFATSIKIANALAAATANGKVVEVYVNYRGVVTDINVITSTVEKIDGITTNKTTGDITYNFSTTADKKDFGDEDLLDEIVLHGEFAKGDVVTTVQGTNFLHVYPTTAVVGAQSAYSTSDSTITVGGTTYSVGLGVTGTTMGLFSNSKNAANYYFDQYGYAVATDAISTVYTNYAQLLSIFTKVSTTIDGATPYVEGRFVMADGTVNTCEIALTYVPATKEYKLLNTVVFDADNTSLDEKTEMDAVINAASAEVIKVSRIYGYSLEEGVISLQNVATSAAANSVMRGVAGAAITTGATSVTVNGKTTLLNEETVYVLYNPITKTADVYTGALPVGSVLRTANTSVVAVCNAANTLATAKIVFGSAYDVSAVGTSDFAWIDASEYTTELIQGTNYRVYAGVKADGTTVTVYGDNAASIVIGDGLYTWNSDMDVTGAFTGSNVVAAQDYTVVGNQMVGESSGVYNLADATVVYVTKAVSEVNNSNCVVILAKQGATVTNDAAIIYVTGPAT